MHSTYMIFNILPLLNQIINYPYYMLQSTVLQGKYSIRILYIQTYSLDKKFNEKLITSAYQIFVQLNSGNSTLNAICKSW